MNQLLHSFLRKVSQVLSV
uniref:Uncharacterized protein n=1 Tax=Rhizophora mucronata TaxID=61149 RepID=A0A2P2PRA0_RHIMU